MLLHADESLRRTQAAIASDWFWDLGHEANDDELVKYDEDDESTGVTCFAIGLRIG